MIASPRFFLFATLLLFLPDLALAQEESPPYNRKTLKLLETFGEAFDRVRTNYVEEVDDQKLIEAAIRGMLSSLDPHSAYLDPQSLKNSRQQTSGKFGGVGMEVSIDEESGHIVVIAPLDDSPAARAGLKAGDLISHVDNQSIRGMNINQAVNIIKGPAGKKVRLTIIRGEKEPFEVSIRRETIKLRSVRKRLEKDIGYIRITSFNSGTDTELKKAVSALEKESPTPPVGYVLDLRNNPGGLLSQAVSVTDAFLGQGEIVSTRGRDKRNHQRYQADKTDIIKEKPLAILINGGSASASEIVAGALQDHKRALIIGTQSFGKGSVQTIVPLENQRDAAIKLTVQRYFTPSGLSIQKRGITPDIVVEQAEVTPLESEKRTQEANLEGALENNQPKEDKNKTKAKNNATDDYQLARALDVIRGIALYDIKPKSPSRAKK